MKKSLTFDDVLLTPRFSHLKSRKDVDISSLFLDQHLRLPIISANMDTVTGPNMAIAMSMSGGIGCLHRFSSVEQNMRDYLQVAMMKQPVIVSVGLGDGEIVRAKSLYEEGANLFCLDVAHGAQIAVVEQYRKLKELLQGSHIIVGNFADVGSTNQFVKELGYWPDAIKIGIGPGSACSTRIKTGVGIPQLSAILQHAACPTQIIADGGCRTSGDVVKALAAGAHAVMLGGMLAGTDETPGEIEGIMNPMLDEKYDARTGKYLTMSWSPNNPNLDYSKAYKKYRGSASKESYASQGKDQAYITAEGESFTVPYKGSVKDVLQDIEGGLRSALTYVGAANLAELRQNAVFIEVSNNTVMENGAHGKK